MALFRMPATSAAHLPVVFRVAGDLPSFQILRRNQGAHNGRGALRARASGDESLQVPAEAVDHLVLLGELVVDLLRLIARALEGGAGAEVVVDRSFVVVAELHHHKVAWLQHREGLCPSGSAQIGAAAEPATARLTTLILAASK